MTKFFAIIIAVILLAVVFKIISFLLGPVWGIIGVLAFILYYPQIKKAFK